MKTTIYFKFDFQSIKNHTYFLVKDERFTDVYFIPINNKVLFISPCAENIYMTLSNDNKEVDVIKKYIKNTIENDEINFNHVFAIDKKEFAKFLKNANKNSEFTFELTEENGNISGICSILKNGKVIDNVFNPAECLTNLENSKYTNIKILLRIIFQMKYNFKKANTTKFKQNISFKYISSINNIINSSKDNSVKFSLVEDEEKKISSINIQTNYGINKFHSQVLISNEVLESIENINIDEDIITKIRKEIIKK